MPKSRSFTCPRRVMKMFAGTDDMYPAVVGFIKAVFEAQGVNPKLREMIVLRVGAF